MAQAFAVEAVYGWAKEKGAPIPQKIETLLGTFEAASGVRRAMFVVWAQQSFEHSFGLQLKR